MQNAIVEKKFKRGDKVVLKNYPQIEMHVESETLHLVKCIYLVDNKEVKQIEIHPDMLELYDDGKIDLNDIE